MHCLYLMHQWIPAAPSPSPLRATAGCLPVLLVPGVGHLQILLCPGARHLPTPGPFSSFWHARGFLSEYNYTEGFTGKKCRFAHLSRTGINWRGLKRQILDFMPAFLHCLSSQNYIAKSRAIDVNQRFFVIESNFCLHYLGAAGIDRCIICGRLVVAFTVFRLTFAAFLLRKFLHFEVR